MVVAYLLLGGLNAVLYNITHYRVIQITSSTATPVIGEDPLPVPHQSQWHQLDGELHLLADPAQTAISLCFL